MNSFVETLIRDGIPAVAHILYEKFGRTFVSIQDHTHHEVIRAFMNSEHPASIIYGSTLLSPDNVLAAATKFIELRQAVPHTATTTDGWNVIIAARKPLTMRENFTTFWVNLDKQPHEFLAVIRAHAAGAHTYACCRYTDFTKWNVGNWFTRGAAERSYQLSLSMLTRAPLLAVTPDKLHSFP